MTGLRKTSKINAVMNLSEKLGLNLDRKEVNEMSTGQLTNKLKEIRAAHGIKMRSTNIDEGYSPFEKKPKRGSS